MPEDALVNTGAVQWPSPDSAYWTVREMQIKLHRWAGEDPSRRFGDLFNLVYHPAFLMHAWERVAGNVGARTPGVDRATVARIETWIGVEAFLDHIRGSLKSGEFEPVEVRQVMIPKASGKLRKLGIPTVADRVVQASLKAVLEPIFEADFKPCSYGFRPNRRAHDAIAEIHRLASEPSNYRWVFEADIKACFDEIDHVALMDRLRARIKDKRVCALVNGIFPAFHLKDTVGSPTAEQQGLLGFFQTYSQFYKRHRSLYRDNDTGATQAVRAGVGDVAASMLVQRGSGTRTLHLVNHHYDRGIMAQTGFEVEPTCRPARGGSP